MPSPKKKQKHPAIRLNYNKRWDESDWENYFRKMDIYQDSRRLLDIHKKPLSKIAYVGTDEVKAFEPVMRAFGQSSGPSIVDEIKTAPFFGDENPEADYHPSTDEDPHYWLEGAPLASVLIYRDACRFAICTSLEIDRYVKRKGPPERKKFGPEYEALRFHAIWIALNIAQGHRLGYAPDRVRGNVAKCLRAITHADTCISLLGRISKRTKSGRIRSELFSFAAQLRNALFHWVDELRLKAG
jgi:hypothetical protein